MKSSNDPDHEIRVKTETNIIPFIIRVLYPTLTKSEFKKLCESDRIFMNRTTFVCEECYLHISQTSQYCGLNLRPFKEKGLIGTHDLIPDKMHKKPLRKRRESQWQDFLKRRESH